MPRRQRDAFDHLCNSVEIFMCGAGDANMKPPPNNHKADKIVSSDQFGSPSLMDDDWEATAATATATAAATGTTTANVVTPTKATSLPPEVEGIEKEIVSVTIRKSSPTERSNLELASYYEKKGIYIKGILEESKFANSNLKVGMKLVKVNGEDCPDGVRETIDAMAKSPTAITVAAVVVEFDYGEDDFLFKEILKDVPHAKFLTQTNDDETKEEAGTPPRERAAAWLGWLSGTKSITNPNTSSASSTTAPSLVGSSVSAVSRSRSAPGATMDPNHHHHYDDPTEEKTTSRLEESKEDRAVRIKNTITPTERDRIGLGFADRMLKQIGVIEKDQIDDDSLEPASTFDDGTILSGPDHYFDDDDDDDLTMTTTGESTIRTDGGDTVTINSTTHHVFARIVKKKRKDNVGIHFVSFKRKKGVYVYRIHEESKFVATPLEPGMKVVTINGEPCPKSVADTLSLVKAVKGELIIEAIHPTRSTANKLPPSNNNNTTTTTTTTTIQEEGEGDKEDAPTTTNTTTTNQDDAVANVPATIVVDSSEDEDSTRGGEDDDDDDEEEEEQEEEEESLHYESLPTPKHAMEEKPKRTGWKAALGFGSSSQ